MPAKQHHQEHHYVILPSLCYYCANNGARIEKKVGSKILLICKKCYVKDRERLTSREAEPILLNIVR